jgi:uncharacterized membrane protein
MLFSLMVFVAVAAVALAADEEVAVTSNRLPLVAFAGKNAITVNAGTGCESEHPYFLLNKGVDDLMKANGDMISYVVRYPATKITRMSTIAVIYVRTNIDNTIKVPTAEETGSGKVVLRLPRVIYENNKTCIPPPPDEQLAAR